MRTMLRTLKNRIMIIPFLATHRGLPKFECPVCSYLGPFATKTMNTGPRINARCPKCNSLERHRIQYLVMLDLFKRVDFSKAKMIHFAPEHFFTGFFRKRVGKYETADINPKGVDHQVDLRSLPFPDASFDLAFASHVLEHIDDDGKAISEIRRILRPNGIAVLPVPIVAEKTIEYPEANPFEEYHVRAPGLDYFDRYRPAFAKVELHRSSDFPEKHQCYIYEDRSKWPTSQLPLLPTTPGERHGDIIPICFANGNPAGRPAA